MRDGGELTEKKNQKTQIQPTVLISKCNVNWPKAFPMATKMPFLKLLGF